MKKVALVFLLGVFVPSLVLAWLAVRSLRDQQIVLERQQALLYQGVADGLAKEVVGFLQARQREFNQQVEGCLSEGTVADAANPGTESTEVPTSIPVPPPPWRCFPSVCCGDANLAGHPWSFWPRPQRPIMETMLHCS